MSPFTGLTHLVTLHTNRKQTNSIILILNFEIFTTFFLCSLQSIKKLQQYVSGNEFLSITYFFPTAVGKKWSNIC